MAALLLLGLGAGASLLLGIAETVGGDAAGVQHLVPALLIGGLMWLGWARPRAGGIVVLALAGTTAAALAATLAVSGVRPEALWGASAIVLIPVLAGLLLLAAGRDAGHRRGGGPPAPG